MNLLKTGFAALFIVIMNTGAYAQYKHGWYYTKDGQRVEGFIKFKYGGSVFTNKSDGDCSISFRTERKGKGKSTNFTTNDICCFVIEDDSFAIMKDFRLNALVSYPQDFAKVVASGVINLYKYYSTVQSGNNYGSHTIEDWYIEKDGQVDKLTNKKFKEIMPGYVSEYPDLVEKIEKHEFTREHIVSIVKLYNKYMKSAGQ